jgi:hypothetical protein
VITPRCYDVIPATPLNLAACRRDPFRDAKVKGPNSMKIALLVLLGLVLGALGGAAVGIGVGLAWVEIFKTSNFEGYSGLLVFFTFMPLGATIGGLGGALLFGSIALRCRNSDREQLRAATRHLTTTHMKAALGFPATHCSADQRKQA